MALDGAGDDIRIFDRCGVNEGVDVEVSADGTNFFLVNSYTVTDFTNDNCGAGSFNATLDIDLSGTGLPFATHVKIIDDDDSGDEDGTADAGLFERFYGLDIEEVVALNSVDASATAIVNDGCDANDDGSDVKDVIAFSDGTTIFVHFSLCGAIDPKVKYRVHFDYTDQTNQDDDDFTDEAPDTPDNTGCLTTSDDTMKRQGSRDTGPGTITGSGDMLWYAVDYVELTKNGAVLGTGDQVLISIDTQYKGSNDRAPTTEGGDGCFKPQHLSEMLDLTLE